jgi:Flp pilus assembly protein TadD
MDAYGNLGIAYGQLGRFAEAIQAFKQAIKISPDNAALHFTLGSVYLEAGDKDSAAKEYEILKTLDAEKANELLSLINK